MTSRTVARRYAKGLLGAVKTVAPGQEEAIRDQVAAIVEAVRGHAALQLLVINPTIAAPRKTAILAEIGAKLGVAEVVTRFLAVVADKERLDHLELISAVFAELVDEHLGIVTANVTTPAPLNPGQKVELEKSLREATGAEVRLSVDTDETMLGGIVTRIGDLVYDGSLRGHLSRIRERLET